MGTLILLGENESTRKSHHFGDPSLCFREKHIVKGPEDRSAGDPLSFATAEIGTCFL